MIKALFGKPLNDEALFGEIVRDDEALQDEARHGKALLGEAHRDEAMLGEGLHDDEALQDEAVHGARLCSVQLSTTRPCSSKLSTTMRPCKTRPCMAQATNTSSRPIRLLL